MRAGKAGAGRVELERRRQDYAERAASSGLVDAFLKVGPCHRIEFAGLAPGHDVQGPHEAAGSDVFRAPETELDDFGGREVLLQLFEESVVVGLGDVVLEIVRIA